MSIAKTLKAEQQKRRVQEPMKNLSIMVTGSNLASDNPRQHTVTGTILGTNEQVTISLREDQKDYNGHSRPEMKDVLHKVAVSDGGKKPGGILSFENCRKTGENTYSSAWAHRVVPNPNNKQRMASYGWTTINPVFKRANDQNSSNRLFTRLHVVSKAEAFPLSQADAIKASIAAALEHPAPNHPQYVPEVMVRLVDNTENADIPEVAIARVAGQFNKENDNYVPVAGNAALESLLQSDRTNARDLQSLLELTENPEFAQLPKDAVFIEIIPVQRNSMGQKSVENYFTTETTPGPRGDVTRSVLNEQGKSLVGQFRNEFQDPANPERMRNYGMATLAMTGFSFLKDDDEQPTSGRITTSLHRMGDSYYADQYRIEHIPTANFDYPALMVRKDLFIDNNAEQQATSTQQNQNANSAQAAPAQAQGSQAQPQAVANEQASSPQQASPTHSSAPAQTAEPAQSQPAAQEPPQAHPDDPMFDDEFLNSLDSEMDQMFSPSPN
ncbi:hypothetical protein [Aliagarivorans taiwanensis]|uniref:hypothetical protein n=1 Tax=Aliagarivorans taiwanensis TaxID=561966 RepID=UPI0004115F20|nr:hypothetical protein [Aliagarivorans taiwanensis]